MYSAWLSPFGLGIFITGLIAAVIIFAIKRKFYPVMYLISIATYIFTVGFVIDAFDLGKNGVLLSLAFSAMVFILLGVYFGNKFNKVKDSFEKEIPSKSRR